MTRLRLALVLALVGVLAAPPHMAAQTAAGPEIWRAFTQRLDPGTQLKVRLISGQRFRATLLQVSDEAMTIQPRTRAPVPPQHVPFSDVASLEIDTARGTNIGKAIAIGAGVAAGAFFGLMALAVAVWGD